MDKKERSEEEVSELTEEQSIRILENLEEETPKVAKELYPNDSQKQENFIEGVYKTVMIMGGCKDAELIEKESRISVKQIERILEKPIEEGIKVAKELYPKNKSAQQDFIDYIKKSFKNNNGDQGGKDSR